MNFVINILKKLPTRILKSSLKRMKSLRNEKLEEVSNLNKNIEFIEEELYRRRMNEN